MKDLAIVTKLMLKEKRDIFYSIIAGFIAGIAAVGLFAASGYLISKAALAPPLYALIILTSTVKLLGFTRALTRYAERYFSHRATFTILSNLRVSFFEKLEPLTPGIFQKYRSGDLLSRIVGDVESLQNFFLRVFYPPIVLMMVFLSTILFTLYFSIYTAIVLLIGLVLIAFVVPVLFAMKQRKINSQVREERGRLSTEATELLYGFRDLKIYQKLRGKEQELLETSKSYISEQEKEEITIAFSKSVNTFISLFITWVVLGIGAYLVATGQMAGIFLAMFVMIAITVFEDAAAMAVFPIYLNDSKRAANRLFSVVRGDEDSEVESGNWKEFPDDKILSIEMDNVSFTFPNEWRKTLEDITVEFPAGSKTAIVGPSGSGKSTLLQLLMKMYPADVGDIRIGDFSISDVSQESLWSVSNVVLQENHFFYGTIRDNLQLAGDELTDGEMEEVLLKVKLDDFSLADPVFEKGENLSGGEKQRLAIARTMLKDESYWFLDEPTSSVDALTEQSIYRHLFEQAKDDTLVLVSHRLTGLERMDQIIVMDQGRIMESGTFEELMQQEGYFYEMKEIEKDLF
ncbi:thiol reductant ABC exporter subunit CydC [Virgibacillus profundi]|uniref:Thiol reductant ABC exporter subunit CydC n=1 Tax=Virgibacillus profundi TaxID=2024555 RepID=A0A2A2IAD3_9BACI|nr:thiol reductant ABC exporter subunit CydC [Virgibacillus profundi]PAV28244.1 thiol reductant ABC exporter subunit CydC [Virgibacillus profundi]PXY52549.1 thiol reductant ABC exporter subunit CydC [Virgibacillus profundi]